MPEGGGRSRRGRKAAAPGVFARNKSDANRALYHCNYCERDISDNVRIKCAECTDFDLCVECFCAGVEVNGHKSAHAYRVMDNLSFPIFHPNWGSDEELLLLEAVDIYGPGNWAAVAEHVGTKSLVECFTHYFAIYIEPDSCPLPTPAPEMAGLDVRKLAEMAKLNCGRKRMRLDPAAAAQLQAQHMAEAAAEAAAAAAAQQQQQAQAGEQQPGVQVKAEPAAQQAAAGAAAAAVASPAVKLEGSAAAGAAAGAAAAAADAGGGGPEPMAVDGVKLQPKQQLEQQEQQQQQQEQADTRPQHDHEGGRGIGKGSFSSRQRAAGDVAAVTAAAGGANAATQAAAGAGPPATAAHATTGGLGKHQAAPKPADPPVLDAGAGAAAPAGAAGGLGSMGSGVGLGGAGLSVAAAAAAAAAGGETHRVKGSGPQLDVMTGWHAKRLEFEPECDNDAEAAIADIEFKEGEPPEQVAAKLRMLEIYNRRLDERERRHAFVLEHGLLNVKRMQGSDKKRMPGEKERCNQMRVFARYAPPGSHDALVEGLIQERRMRVRIAELQAHRAAGRRTMAEVDEAELLEASAKKKAKDKAAREAAGLLPSDEGLGQACGTGAASAAAAAAAAAGGGGPTTLGGYRSTASALSIYRQRRGVNLDITGLPGAELLSAREAELCASVRLLPAHYLSLKDVMMRDALIHGHISRQDARCFFRLDPSRSARVWEVLCAAGWLQGTDPEEAEAGRRGGRGGGGGAKAAVAAATAAAAASSGIALGAATAAAAAPSLAIVFPPAPGGGGDSGGAS